MSHRSSIITSHFFRLNFISQNRRSTIELTEEEEEEEDYPKLCKRVTDSTNEHPRSFNFLHKKRSFLQHIPFVSLSHCEVLYLWCARRTLNCSCITTVVCIKLLLFFFSPLSLSLSLSLSTCVRILLFVRQNALFFLSPSLFSLSSSPYGCI